MHTIKQADKLWCPMSRVVFEGDPTPPRNRTKFKADKDAYLHFSATACISDSCAMWRWVPKTAMRLEIIEEGLEHREVNRVGPVDPTHGFCGLAGRPGSAA